MITFIPKRETTAVYNSRIIKGRSSFSLSSFFPIIHFYIIKPASTDFLLDQIYIKLPNNSFVLKKKYLFFPVLHWIVLKKENSCCINLKKKDLSALEMLGAITHF